MKNTTNGKCAINSNASDNSGSFHRVHDNGISYMMHDTIFGVQITLVLMQPSK